MPSANELNNPSNPIRYGNSVTTANPSKIKLNIAVAIADLLVSIMLIFIIYH